MSDINCFGGIVRILEIPALKLNKNEIPYTKFRVQLSQVRLKQSKSILTILAYGNLANDIVKYYRINDYVLIEGYLSIRKALSKKKIIKKFVEVKLFKIFPLFLNSKCP
jgi:Single-strand binding protein family